MITDGPERYAQTDLLLTYRPAGQNTTTLNFEHTDADEDGHVGAGDAITGMEPGTNLLGPEDAGRSRPRSLPGFP